MPYKDADRSREYQREYKQRQRAKAKMSNPRCPTLAIPMYASQALSKNMKRKDYLCPKIPDLRLPGIIFKNGFFITDRVDEQIIIEPDSLYGEGIVSWPVEPNNFD